MVAQEEKTASLSFPIGANVHCRDGRCGKLTRVVMDPHTYRVTDLIVEKGFLLKEDRVIPISTVEGIDDQEIRLAIDSEQLRAYPEYREEDFTLPAPDWVHKRYSSQQVRYWIPHHGLVYDEPVVPLIRRKVRKGVRYNREVIERGTPVRTLSRRVGTVDHVLVDRESGELTHLIVRRGLLPDYRVIPMSMIESADEDGIYLRAREDELEALPRYKPREKADVLAELRDRLSTSDLDLSQVKATFQDGIARLTGSVASVEAKRRAEATARSVDGVIDVENVLRTDTAVAAKVAAALQEDPRTELAVIEVICERGIVTLKGKVDTAEARDAAEEIAEQQEGIVEVINALRVAPDDDTEALLAAAYASAAAPPANDPTHR